MSRRLLAIGCVLLLSGQAHAEPVTPLFITGESDNRIDVVFVGDGYTASEMDLYAANVDEIGQYFLAEEPFADYQTYINIRRIDVISNESGADHPERDEFKDTALDATFNCGGIQRLVCVDFTKTNAVLDASVSLDERDVVIVLVNDPERGGSGGAFAVLSTGGADWKDVAVHEVGHSFGLLADEYFSSPPACNVTFEPSAANLTLQTNRNLIKWNAGGGPPTGWIDPATPVPHQDGFPPDQPGLFDGGGYCEPGEGMYRPTDNSRMRTSTEPFGPVSVEQLIKQMYNYVYPVETQFPVEETLIIQNGDGGDYSIVRPVPLASSLDTFWYFDQQLIQTGGDSFSVTPAQFTPGGHQVFVWVHDNTTKVRNDPNSDLWGFAIWTVFVATPGDRDGDGVPDAEDAFPDDPWETADFDGDLVGDNADTDDDNDTVPDSQDAFPNDPKEWFDTDGDGIGDNSDEVPLSQRVLLGADITTNVYSLVNENTGSEIAFFNLVLEGETITKMHGIADHPTTFELYAAVQLASQPNRTANLLQFNLNTGQSVNLGNTGQPISGMAFDDQGVLYAVSGDCSAGCAPPAITEALFTLDLQTAEATLVQQLGNGDDGEAIAFNEDDGLLYHRSGRGANMVFETIDRTTAAVTNIPLSGDSVDGQATVGMVYDEINQRFVGTTWNRSVAAGEFGYVSPTGVVSTVGPPEYNWGDFTYWNLLRAGRTDIDNDGFPDFVDEFPTDGADWTDFDGDGVGNNTDPFPQDASESSDTDMDGVGDNADNCPAISNSDQLDSEADGIGDVCDDDDDGDGLPDVSDPYPLGRFTDAGLGYWAFIFIETLANEGITGGCGGDLYCPDNAVTRAQMAVFLERGINGSGFSPPAATGTLFNDVGANDFAAAFIEQLANDGITGGCGGGNYCPNADVTRAQMAVFLLRAKNGSAYAPPPATGVFPDVPIGSFADAWIEQLAAEGISGGCGGGNFCPNDPVTRAQMAVFLVRAFEL